MADLPSPLDGITVVDMTIALAGPYATQLLGALGRDRDQGREPGRRRPVAQQRARTSATRGLHLAREGADDMSVSMLERGRNKLSVTLDLKQPGGPRASSPTSSRAADVVVENFSAGTADRLGVGYERARELNPRIVYLSISGFGAGEPGKGMDTIFQALSGLMTTPGSYGDPPVRNAVPFGDLIGPALRRDRDALGALMRERTGPAASTWTSRCSAR